MTVLSNTVYSYQDIKDLFTRAIHSDRGLRIKMESRQKAKALAQKFNTYRARDRQNNGTIYPEGHPLFYHSIYDAIEVAVRETPEGGEVQLIKSTGEMYDVEEL